MAGIVAVAADDDLDLRPATADCPDDMADHLQNFGTVRCLAGTQDHRDWLAAASVIDVHGKKQRWS